LFLLFHVQSCHAGAGFTEGSRVGRFPQFGSHYDVGCSWRATEREATMAMNDTQVLLVDDDKDTCSNLSDILTDRGYTVDVAYQGEQALDLFSQHPYRLTLVDYKLPGMTGVELFQQMRRISHNVEGLLVTAFASAETTSEALAAGLQQVVHKPVDIPKLMPFIDEALA
jgi:CheY-like chemotaxis protein